MAQAAVAFVSSELDARRDAIAADVLATYRPGGAEWEKQVTTWKAAAEQDPALGDTPDARKAAIQQGHLVVQKYAEAHPTDAKGFTDFLSDSGLGNNPAVVRFFAWLGKMGSEGTILNGGSKVTDPDNSEEARAARILPNTRPKPRGAVATA